MKKSFILILTAFCIICLSYILCTKNALHKPYIKEMERLNDSIETLINQNKNYISELKYKDSILADKDSVIIIKWRTKRDSIFIYTLPNFTEIYSNIVNSPVLQLDSLICFDSLQIRIITDTLYAGYEAHERLANCLDRIDIKDSTISYQDSVIIETEKLVKVWRDGAYSLHNDLKKCNNKLWFWRVVAFIEGVVILVK